MSQQDLQRYVKAVSPERLPALLKAPGSLQVAPLGVAANLSEVRETFAQLSQVGSTERERSVWDRELVQPLHQALRSISRRDASDMRFWHWMCVNQFPMFVWARWHGQVVAPADAPGILGNQPALVERFLGTASLRGVSRNALARLWWCAETLSDGGRDYSLVREALINQDFFQAIFERKLGLYPATARVLLRVLRDAKEKQRRDVIKRLNHYFTTIVQESLEEEEIERLLTS
ncbi:MAG TPA: DUF6339 family protein [Symbiobacteriaceae bacterium]|nr:DUF6339 family protein [Symbiobacteriaceae bacterium]